MNRGCSLPELLLGASLLTLLAGVSFGSAVEALARQRIEGTMRRLGQSLEEARSMAEQRGEPCAIHLDSGGWAAPNSGLRSCLSNPQSQMDARIDADLQLSHNLPAQLRISANGLPIDGGTVVLRSSGTSLQHCLVLALPLGVVRYGHYSGSSSSGPVNSAACLPARASGGS